VRPLDVEREVKRVLLLALAGLAGVALAVMPALAADQNVGTDGSKFEPEDVAVVSGAGDVVTISNSNGGFAPHDLRWDDGAPGEPGATKSMADQTPWSVQRTFDSEADGTYGFYCSVHGGPNGEGMSGRVHVNSAGTVPTGGGGGTTTGGGGTTTGTSTTPPPGGTTTTSTTPPPGGTTTTPPPGSDEIAPRLIGTPRARGTRRGVRLTLNLSEPADVTVRLFRGVRRIARRTFAVERSGPVVLRIRRALRRGRYRLRLTLVDEAGNRSARMLRTRVR
jgi:plastocyanin